MASDDSTTVNRTLALVLSPIESVVVATKV